MTEPTRSRLRAAIYTRISKDRTGEELGVTRQREDCETLCADRGWDVTEVYVDNDLSAYSGKARPSYARLLDAVRADEVDVIVAWHPDRLHRSPRELETFVELVEEHACAIATVRAGDVDLSTASGRMTARVVGAVARAESEQKSERIRRALEQNAKAGKRHGGGRPFGFEADGVTVYEPEAVLLRSAAERVLAGETVTGIARDWNTAGVRTPRGAAWSPTPVRGVLVAPRVAGLRALNGTVMGDAVWDGILDRATWERLTSLLARTARVGRPAAYLLSNIARCGVPVSDDEPETLCGGPLWGSRSGARVRYLCHSGPGRDGCGRIAVATAQLDTYVREAVFDALTADGGRRLAQARKRRAGSDKRQAKAAADLAAAEAGLEELAGDYYGDRLITRREFLTGRERAEARIAAAKRVLGRGDGDGVLGRGDDERVLGRRRLPKKRDELAAMWETEDVVWRRAVIGAVIDRVVIKPATTRGPKLDKNRVEIVWR